jgi:OPA family glycerol-3-phosphate transporter-like MFS transporter
VALLLFVRLRDKPEDAGLPHIRDDEAPPLPAATAAPAADLSVWDIIRLTLSSRVLWILAVSYFCFNAVRYAFMNWSVQYFAAFHSIDIKGSALRAVAFPLVGALGAISSGWVSDRFFQGRRAPVCSLMLLVLGGLCLLLIVVPAGQPTAATALIALAGFMIYGPDAILSGAAAIDLAHPKAAASATGFIMAMGNLGNAIFSGVGVGFVLTQTGGSWTWVFSILSALSVAAAAMAARLWNEKPRRRP